VVGGVGRGVTVAMQEYSRYHWFEAPVYATVRAGCCGKTSLELPSSMKCDPPVPELTRIAAAVLAHAPLDEPIKAYRKSVECLVGCGEQSIYGEVDVVRGGEETAFRLFTSRAR
jgi:hypothetical protein